MMVVVFCSCMGVMCWLVKMSEIDVIGCLVKFWVLMEVV